MRKYKEQALPKSVSLRKTKTKLQKLYIFIAIDTNNIFNLF